MAQFVLATGLSPEIYWRTPLRQIEAIRIRLNKNAQKQEPDEEVTE